MRPRGHVRSWELRGRVERANVAAFSAMPPSMSARPIPLIRLPAPGECTLSFDYCGAVAFVLRSSNGAHNNAARVAQ